MHSADIILIWNSFLSAVAGTTPAWLHPKSITLLGPLASIWRGTEWHSVQALSQTFNLKDNVVFHFEGHLRYGSDVVFYGWGDCRITSKHSLIQITHCESWLEAAILSCQSGWNRDNKWMQTSIFKAPSRRPSLLTPQQKYADRKAASCPQKTPSNLCMATCHMAPHHYIYGGITPVLNKHPHRCLPIHLQQLLVMDPLWKVPNAPGCNDTGNACCKTVAYGWTTQH